MKEIRHILSCTRRAVEDYNMIEDGDRIAVGVSAGKDSLTLLCALANLKLFYGKKFSLYAVTVDMGFDGVDFSPVRELCHRLNVPYHVYKTEIAKIVFDVRKETNPSSLCARMRRGALHDAALELGCNKIALGHHFDDSVETFMLNLFFEGRIGSFSPVTYLSRKDLTMIRPLIYCEEKDIRYFANKFPLPVIESPCSEDGNTERENMKQLLNKLNKENRGLKHRIFTAMQNGKISGYEKTLK